MKIRFQSRHGIQRVECRDLMGGDLTVWTNGQERDVDDEFEIQMRLPDQRVVKRNAVDAVLSLGPDFVDASTGVNPFFQCHRCLVATTDEYLDDPSSGSRVHFVDADGDRLCLIDFLADRPEFVPLLKYRGIDPAILEEAAKRREADSPAIAEAHVAAIAAAPQTYAQAHDAADAAAGEE